MTLLARLLFALARLGDALELHRMPLYARDVAIRCLHTNMVRRHVRWTA
jgi:hypothetical protein